jgi:ankyrin repeat protein
MFVKTPKFNIQYISDLKGNKPLSIACKYGRIRIVEYFLEKMDWSNKKLKQAILHKNNKGYSAFHFAVESGQLTVLKLLVAAGADTNDLTEIG